MTTTETPTTASKVGIVYSKGTKHVRGHIYADHDGQWPDIEGAIRMDNNVDITYIPMSAHHGGHDVFHAAIAQTLGHPTVDFQHTAPRCAVIDNATGLVEMIIMADDSFDTIDGKTLVNCQRAEIGHSWDAAARQFTAPSRIERAKVGVRAADDIISAETYSPVRL